MMGRAKQGCFAWAQEALLAYLARVVEVHFNRNFTTKATFKERSRGYVTLPPEAEMARHRLTDAEMLRGVKKALKSARCPAHLKPGLRRLQERLEARIERRKHPAKRDFLSRMFGF
jgi:hypothetical protein